MMTIPQSTLIVILTLASAIVAAPAESLNTPNYYLSGSDTANPVINEEKAIRIVQQHIKGRVLAINLLDQTYRIKLLDYHGGMHIIQVSAQDGSIISTH